MYQNSILLKVWKVVKRFQIITKMQSATQQKILDDLFQTLTEFITDLGSIFQSSDEKSELTVIEFFYKRMHKETIMQHAINMLLPFKDKVDKRNLKFFEQNKYIFAGLPDDRVAHYNNLIVNLPNDDVGMIWDYLDVMIACAETYKKGQ